MQTKFGAATDKDAFINGLQIRLLCSKLKGSDNVNWGVAYCKLVYQYPTPAPPSGPTIAVLGSHANPYY
jgi:hypothetical protein